jgi:hypothetical protein
MMKSRTLRKSNRFRENTCVGLIEIADIRFQILTKHQISEEVR